VPRSSQRYDTERSISAAPAWLAVQRSQVTESVDRQTAGIADALVSQSLDMACKRTPPLVVQIVSGHTAINLHRSEERP
jgi:hypothetical protein